MRLIQQAGPPANSVTRLTPEKEEENTQKSVEESETLNSIKELTGNIYFAVDNKNDTDFGQNGFLSADRFKSGDCLPLLNDKIQENLDLPKLEFCDYGDCNQVRNDSLDDKNNANVDDLWSAVEEGRALETKGINKIEPNNHWTFHQNIQNNKNIEKENLTSKLNNIGINTITTIAPSITSNTTTTTTATTLGNNRHQLFDTNRLNFNDQTLLYLPPQNISPQNRQIQIDREKTLKKRRKQHSKDKGLIIKPQEEPGYVGYEDVDVIMKAMGFEQPQQSQRSQKATSPGNGVNIGSSIISNNLSINCNSSTKKQLKKQKQKPRQQQNKNNSIKHEINTSINGDKHQSNTSSLDGNVVEMDVEEEMDVEIELDTVDEPKQQDIVEDINKSIEEIKTLENDNKKIENEQIKQLEEFKEEKEILNKNIEEEQNKGNNQQIKQKEEKEKPKWVSSKLEENKRLWKQKIDETPLIKRIPKSLLNSLGWRNPITIISPFANRNNNQSIDKEEANKIWKQNPAPENFLEKTIIEQKFIQNKTKQKGGGGGHSGGGRGGGGHFRQTQQRKQMSTNRRAMN
ncbi:hypothetical protein ACQ4LE_011056 [Meloidogyne hapla]|uniref:Uncharacterized protein n=1 Tax=Meloidogyne hapla TaxID=6305 RepID=A0A1I8B6D0_MELHA